MAKDKIIAIHWLPKSYLTDTELMDRATEHAYFRLLQYIYLTQDNLQDNDTQVARLLKCSSVRVWRKIKSELMLPRGIDPETGEEIGPRIYLEGGKLRSKKCIEKLAQASKSRHQQSKAGKASFKKRKSLKSNNSSLTAELTAVTTGEATPVPTADGVPVPTNLKGLLRNPIPLPLTPVRGASGSGDPHPTRHSIPAEPETVEFTMPTGARITITKWGSMDEVWAPRDCEPTLLSSDQAMAIRRQLLDGVKPADVKIPSEQQLLEQAGQTALTL